MKNRPAMKTDLSKWFAVFFFCCLLSVRFMAQETEMTMVDKKPVKNTFGSIWIIDNPTVMVPYKGTLEFDIQHRFGLIYNGYEDFWGLYAPSNIRLGFGYVPVNNLMLGFGLAKKNLTWDFNARYSILRQMSGGGSPVSITYYGNAAMDTRDQDQFPNPAEFESTDRWSFFHQLLLARKISDKFSLQVGGSVSHFNAVYPSKDPETGMLEDLNNDHFALALSARYKISNATSIMVNYDQPLTTRETSDAESPESKEPKPNLALGFEFTTSSHQFQIFFGNYDSLVPQINNTYNSNWGFGNEEFSLWDPEWLIGFNITRLWSY